MTLKTLSSLFLLSSGALFAVGCGGADDGAVDGDDSEVSEAEAVSAKVTPGSFKLYAQPGTPPSPGCDVHTHLTLAANGTAALEERVGGMCMIAVMPDPRTYRIRLVDTPCGSRVYTGKLTKQGKVSTIKITDHRSRMCMDAIPSQVIVEETRNGVSTKKYGNAEAAPVLEETITGQLVRSFGIGGENTGASVKDASGKLTELVLDAGERARFVEGRTARVKGVVTYLSGIETHDRKALDVNDMLVCPSPGFVDCMPGPTPRSNLCAAENRSWVEANCAGVSFAD